MGKPRNRIYVGYKGGLYLEVFRSAVVPTQRSNPEYNAVIGPFRTLQGAKCMVHYGVNNPHIQNVNDAERIAPKYSAELASLPESKQW